MFLRLVKFPFFLTFFKYFITFHSLQIHVCTWIMTIASGSVRSNIVLDYRPVLLSFTSNNLCCFQSRTNPLHVALA